MSNEAIPYLNDAFDVTPVPNEGKLRQDPSTVRNVGATVRIFDAAAHPDDAEIGSPHMIGMQDQGALLAFYNVTFGSKPERRMGRLAEQVAACEAMGAQLIPHDLGYLDIDPYSTTGRKHMIMTMAEAIDQYRPTHISTHGRLDAHPAHVLTSEIVEQALDELHRGGYYYKGQLIETMFWGGFNTAVRPNTLYSFHADTVQRALDGLRRHHGEISRIPYHTHLPAFYMRDTIIGSELIGGKGAPVIESYQYSQLLRVSDVVDGKPQVIKGSHFINPTNIQESIFIRGNASLA